MKKKSKKNNFSIKKTKKGGTQKVKLYNDLVNKHYKYIFPNNANRNSAGFKFFSYIYDNLAKNETLFDIYNQFYCAVSGSIVSPERNDNYSIIKVRNKNNECVVGKYFRCCEPCDCDIMKYTEVVKVKIEIPKNSGNYYQKYLITIGDPCFSGTKFPNALDKNIFRCQDKVMKYGYRVNSDNKLTKGSGRLVVGVLYPINSYKELELNKSIKYCSTGTKRFFSHPDDLKYGMGDIFVKLALMNNSRKYSHNLEDLCKT